MLNRKKRDIYVMKSKKYQRSKEQDQSENGEQVFDELLKLIHMEEDIEDLEESNPNSAHN
jgi:hypothetical protein